MVLVFLFVQNRKLTTCAANDKEPRSPEWLRRDGSAINRGRLVLFALDRPALSGAVNATAPEPVRQEAFIRALAATFRRRVLLRAPAPLLRRAMGELSSLFLSSQRVVSSKATGAGFSFTFATPGAAFADLFAKPCPTGSGGVIELARRRHESSSRRTEHAAL